ncbi:phage tail protein [Vibrio fluvialis]|uniref:phage tail-collar fiber domain-containing protein n=1 Tax=Vibrio fluvialis TaxID=676 RepID=UPI001EEBC7C8|nr:phage tail protein [Vibrio fluvialis]MCG6389424.1 phage tail protein [Vibrio fluvialis]
MSLLITHAGIAAAIRASDLGIEYRITHISIGSAGYVPNPEQTALVAEIQKKAITRGALVAQGQLHFETVWDGDEEFEGKELGYWLEDGTLFAVDSRDGEVITYKRKNTVVTEACELNLAASTIENITVEMLGSPYATEQVAGIAKIVTTGQVDTGTDDRAFLTVKKFLYALDVTTVVDKLVTNLWLKLAARSEQRRVRPERRQFRGLRTLRRTVSVCSKVRRLIWRFIRSSPKSFLTASFRICAGAASSVRKTAKRSVYLKKGK